MKVNQIVYEHHGLYPAYYLGDACCQPLRYMILFLEKSIPQYTHEDVLRFLTDDEFRHSVIIPFKTNFPALINLDKKWYQKYEKEIGRKNWYRKAVRIVSRLIELPDPSPLKKDSIEMEIYQAVLNSEQYIIPIIYSNINELNPKRHDVFNKGHLLKHFDIYGLKFIEFYFAWFDNYIPFIEVIFEYYHTWEKSKFEIYLPYSEMKRLYEKIYKEEYPQKH
ncbi:MAG: hypothetical protein FH758_03955 [Firmicutes bacterium]|nr:hypothetical protein [Bacillota bacterium]